MREIVQFLIAAVSTVTFAILFSAPKKELFFCGISGGLAWLVYFMVYQESENVVLGSLVATFVLTILCRILAVARCTPATVYLVSGIFPLVPGAGIYYTAYYLISGMSEQCSAKGLETFEIALAIVFGIIFGFSIPEALFHKWESRKNRRRERENV